jgi:hypothetical protein
MNETYWNAAESSVGDYISYDDDYIFPIPIGDEESDIWVSQYQILYFFASLCFVAVGVLDLILERHCLHTIMILAGLFGVLSAIFVENDIRLSNVFSVVSVCLFFFEAASVFRRRKNTSIVEERAILSPRRNYATADASMSMRRALLLGDFCFMLATMFDIIVSILSLLNFHLNTNLMLVPHLQAFLSYSLSKLEFSYVFDTTIDWDTSMMVFGIVAALLWLLCSLMYIWAFFYDFFVKVKVLKQQGTTQHVNSETTDTEHPPPMGT